MGALSTSPKWKAALSSSPKWIPEDDLLLKNAIESGASLESLAKGAVCFSRRVTLRELQDRWHSLLYDMDTSMEASARMIEIEIELSLPNPPKASRACDYKGKDCSFGKRKVNSVRSHYHGMRKRVCNKPCSAADLGLGSACCCGDELKPKNELPCNNFAVVAPISDHYGHMETSYGEYPDGIVGNDCLYRYAENTHPMSTDKAGGNDGEQSFDHEYVEKDFRLIPEENLISLKACSDVQEIRQPQNFHTTVLYESDNIEAKPLSAFDLTDDNHERLCSGFVGNPNLTLQAPECSDSFHELGYSSVKPGLPMWRSIEDISTPTIPMDGHLNENKDEEVLTIDAAGYDGATSEPRLNDAMCSAGLGVPAILSDDFIDFSGPYIDFADDENLLFSDLDVKGTPDRSCINGSRYHLLSSPSDEHQDDVPISSSPRRTELSDPCLVNPDGVCYGESYRLFDQRHKNPSVNASEIDGPSTFSGTPCTAEHIGGFIFCTLNTEDPEIPCNDNVFLPAQVLPSFSSSDLEQTSRENAVPVLSNDRKIIVEDTAMVKDELAAFAQPIVPSLNAGSSVLLKMGSMHSSDGCRVEAKPFESKSVEGVSRHAGIAIFEQHSQKSPTIAPLATLKDESTIIGPGKHVNFDTPIGLFLEKPVPESDGCRQKAAVQDTVQKHVPSHAELISAEMTSLDPVINVSISDQEEQFSDSENEVPNFSDIESMILDMDLGPYDQESLLFTKEVSRYQRVDTKKAIIRLEQGAHSYMNRAISSRGAFAVFYGHHLKYFIKDPEVSLGRATEEVEVDIDLGREGHANKISRLQAVIRLDEDGTFILRNIGKCSIFVNGKELLSKKRTSLSSSSLIEIRDMRFIFEVNQSAVSRYLGNLRGSSQEQSERFDWAPDLNP